MTHIEYITHLLAEMEKDFKEEPTTDKDVETFRAGVRFGMKYVIQALKNPNEKISYEG